MTKDNDSLEEILDKATIEDDYVDKAVDFPPISHQEMSSELSRLNSHYRVLMHQLWEHQKSAEALYDSFFNFITEFRHLRMRVLMTEDKED